jgi:hypothetical protein
MVIKVSFVFFQYWRLNPGLLTCQVKTLPIINTFVWGGGEGYETGFLCVALAILELSLSLCKPGCLCLPNAGIKGMCHHRLALFVFLFWDKVSVSCFCWPELRILLPWMTKKQWFQACISRPPCSVLLLSGSEVGFGTGNRTQDL